MTTGISDELLITLKRVASVLKELGVPFALMGGFAVYARGGTSSEHDVDFLIREADVERVLEALQAAGFRSERPPEDWLVKVYDGDLLVDLIFRPLEQEATDEMIAEATPLRISAISVPVLSATTLMAHKILAFSEHYCDYARALPLARSLREQIDWDRVRRDTEDNPYAQAFMVLLESLDVLPRTLALDESGARS